MPPISSLITITGPVGLLPNNFTDILSRLFNMSAGEEEEHGIEAIIKALMKALTDIKGSPTDSLKPPTFDWKLIRNSFEDFSALHQGHGELVHTPRCT